MNSRALAAGLFVIVTGAGFLIWSAFASPTVPEQSEIIESLEAIPAPTVPPTAQTLNDATLESDPAVPEPVNEFPAFVDNALRDVNERDFPVDVAFEIVETLEHDTGAFTQGFEISNGRLFESTGLVGESTIRELNPETGSVLRSTDVPDVFAEGLTIIEDPEGDTAIQITWQDEVAFRYDLENFEVVETYDYAGQGWGICDDGDRLVMSNGSDQLQFRDRDSFELLDTVDVTLSGVPVQLINELECVGEAIWANIWRSSLIIQIDPESGIVTRVLNANDLVPDVAVGSSSDVLNGIAYDPDDGTYLLTGKRWPVTYRVQLFDIATN